MVVDILSMLKACIICIVWYDDCRDSNLTDFAQNLIRQGLYYNYEYYKAQGKEAFINSDRVVQLHVCEFDSHF